MEQENSAVKKGMLQLPESQRPRERLYYQGAEQLSDQELLAILLGSGSRAKNALETAAELLTVFAHEKGIPELANTSIEELMTINGVGKSKAIKIVAAFEVGKRAQQKRDRKSLNCSSPSQIAEHFSPLMENLPREELRAVFLDRKNRLIRDLVLSKGGLSSTVIDPRDVFREAIKANSSALVLLHNHPSGDPQPSPDDLQTTRRFAEAGELLGIRLHDHIIIGKQKFLSLYADENYRPLFIL